MRQESKPTIRRRLPGQGEQLFLTDGGLETTLIFLDGIELPYFAACDLLNSDTGRRHLLAYYRSYAHLAQSRQCGFVLETATWRANPDWCRVLAYNEATFRAVNRDAVNVCQQVCAEFETERTPMVISGCIGPRRDGYQPGEQMSVAAAKHYHSAQIRELTAAGVDMLSAFTLCYSEEAIGVALAAREFDVPVVISYTVETDGCLPTGESLRDAIAAVDSATENAVSYYMINCAHPTHFQHIIAAQEPWLQRIGGLRANASCKSHAELDDAVDLDAGNPRELGEQYRDLLQYLPNLKVLGGVLRDGSSSCRANQSFL